MNVIFGDEWGGAPIGAELPRIATPTGDICEHCGEPIFAEDSGIAMPIIESKTEWRYGVWHRACHLRSIFGSVGHQLGKCSCHSGSEEDDPALTKRQAAEAAVALAFKRNGP